MFNLMKESNNRGFIQIPILISIILGVVVIGGASYIGINKYQTSKKEDADKVAQIDILSKKIEVLENQQATTTNNQKTNTDESGITKVVERIIERPVVIQQKSESTPVVPHVQVQVVASTTVDTKKAEKVAFDIFWQNSQKALNEFNSATKYLTDALNGLNKSSYSTSIAYAQNAIDSCNSGYQVNLNNNVPTLPFSADLTKANQIISTLGAKCKQMAQAYQESFKNYADVQADPYKPFTAVDLATKGSNFMNEFYDIWKNQLGPASDKVVKSAEGYF